jgi:Mg-chelatase subunit ChlD
MHTSGRFGALSLTALAVGLVLASGCQIQRRSEARHDGSTAAADAPYEAAVEEGLGASVAILVDTSGSMRDAAPGDGRPKFQVARQAIEEMLDATDAFAAKRPDFPIKIGLYSFSSDVNEISPIQRYDRARLRAALDRIPAPGGGTAIGDAMREARPALYRAGTFRKYLLVVTDGENTRGRDPERVARDIFSKSEGAVQIYFVAFDTGADKFRFLKDVGGDVVGAGTGPELRTALDKIYQGKILAEAMDAGEKEAHK